MALPAGLKPINKYLTQAKRVAKLDEVVAYYTKLYALQTAMKLKLLADKDCKTYIMKLMDQLEVEKKAIPKLSDAEAKDRCETFALTIFQHADDEDRAGKATKDTSMSFLAAYIFMDVCEQFGELASDIADKRKYAQWKAADIAKAIREGRQPTIGGADERMDLSELGGAGGAGGDAAHGVPAAAPPRDDDAAYSTGGPSHGQPPSSSAHAPAPSASSSHYQPAPAPDSHYPPTHYAPQQPQPLLQPVPQQAAVAPPMASPRRNVNAPAVPTLDSNGVLVIRPRRMEKLQAIVEAEKLAKHAVSGLRFQDVNAAIIKLQEALELLIMHRE